MKASTTCPWLVVEPVTVRQEAERDEMPADEYAALLRRIIASPADPQA